MGQGLDRLMSGEMSLWEYGAIVHNWNDRQPKPDGFGEYQGPMPTEQDWEDMRVATERTVAAAQSRAG